MLQTHNAGFLQELEKLNPAQKEAVDHIEGPVLVIAGPVDGDQALALARSAFGDWRGEGEGVPQGPRRTQQPCSHL